MPTFFYWVDSILYAAARYNIPHIDFVFGQLDAIGDYMVHYEDMYAPWD
jgi:hypothetical protein